MIETLIAGITAFDIYFADLPEYAHSYDGEAREISQFYDQKVPNIYVGGYYDQWNWSVDSGTHTDKLSTSAISIGYTHVESMSNSWALYANLTTTLNYKKHEPCTDDYNREYLCSNLTAWSDFEDKNETKINPSISITFINRF